ncbi:hypothetical protein ASC94_13340 [Massilia sp. Root418]|nr:hypothetical protein ASC94_13340 [Massilia sp. Root418]
MNVFITFDDWLPSTTAYSAGGFTLNFSGNQRIKLIRSMIKWRNHRNDRDIILKVAFIIVAPLTSVYD